MSKQLHAATFTSLGWDTSSQRQPKRVCLSRRNPAPAFGAIYSYLDSPSYWLSTGHFVHRLLSLAFIGYIGKTAKRLATDAWFAFRPPIDHLISQRSQSAPASARSDGKQGVCFSAAASPSVLTLWLL